MKKSIIFNPFSLIPESNKSIEKVEATIWAQRLNADIAFKNVDLIDYHNIYLYHNSSLNCFNKFDDEVVNRFYNLFDAVSNESNLFSLDRNIHEFNYIDQLEKIEGKTSTSHIVDEDFILRVHETFSLAAPMFMEKLNLSKAIIGDQYCAVFAKPDQAVYSTYNLSFEEIENFPKFIKKTLKKRYKEIEICLGANDIKFNFFTISPESFADQYAKEIISLQEKLNAKISVCAPIYVDYKNHSNSKDDLEFMLRFIDRLDEYFLDFDLIKPSANWYKEIFKIHFKQSIPLTNFRSIQNW